MKKRVLYYANLLVGACAAALGVALIAYALHVLFWPLWVGTVFLGYGAMETLDTLRKS